MRRSWPLLFVLAACGRAEAPPPRAPEPVQTARVSDADRRPPPGTLFREDVDAALNRGLGYFLQHVRVEPVLDEGRFLGWELVEIIPRDYFDGVDLVPGDVVTSINGLPIEREFQAHAAFESLRHAQELRVSVQRGGEPREIVLTMVSRTPGTKPSGGTPAPAPSGAARAAPKASAPPSSPAPKASAPPSSPAPSPSAAPPPRK